MGALISELLIEAAVTLVVGLVVYFWTRNRTARNMERRRRLFAAHPDGCIVCGSTDVADLAPLAYRCRDCGHEGGDGLAAYLHERELDAARALPDDQRMVRARGLLLDAGRLLLASEGTWSTVVRASFHDMVGVSANMGEDKQTRIVSALGEVREASMLVERAGVMLDDPALRLPEVDDDELVELFDLDLQARDLHTDLTMHRRLTKLAALVPDMRRRVDGALAALD